MMTKGLSLNWQEVCKRLELDPERIYPALLQDLAQLIGSQPNFELAGLPGGASNRGYLRLILNSRAGAFPDSLMIMILRDLDPKQGIEEVVEEGFEITELPFLNVLKHFRKCGVSVPELYHWNPAAGLIYLEDLGDTLLRDALNSADQAQRFNLLERAVDELIRLQLGAGSCADPNFLGFRMRFNPKLLRWELDHFREWALDKRLGPALQDSDSRMLDDCFKKIVTDLLSAPYILNHRDYHIDNLMIKHGRIRVIDFQDALMAPYPYDLASLLYDRDTSLILGDALIEHIIVYHFQRLSEQGYQPLDFKGFRRVFDLCVLHRAFKIVGRFYFLAMVKHKPEYLKFQPAEYIVLGTYLDRFPEFAPVKHMLQTHLPELK